MGNVKFDNFRWSRDVDPHWDELHLTVELPEIDPTTGVNIIAPNTPRFVMQPPFDEQTYLAYEDLRQTNPDEYVQLPFGIDSLTFKLQFDYVDGGGIARTWEMPRLIDMTEYTLGHWIMCRYKKISCLYPELEPHELHVDYFDYLVGSYYDPILEALLSSATEAEEFLPVVVLMQDKKWYDWPQGTPNPFTGEPGDWSQYPKTDLHRTTDRILKKLAMKGSEIKEKFLEQEADTSSTNNQAEKWDFYLHFAAPLYTSISATAIYLYEFFLRIGSNAQFTYEDYQEYLASTNPNWPYYWAYPDGKRYYKAAQPISGMHITEGSLTGYDVRYGWSYIMERTFQGRFHDDRDAGYLNQGHQEPLLPGQASIQMYERQDGNEFLYRKGLDEMHADPNMRVGRSDEGYHDYIIITRQFGEFDENRVPINMYYSRVLVMALSMEYTINCSIDGNYRLQNVDVDLFDVDDAYKPLQTFRIPLSTQGLKAVPILKREQVIADSLVYTVFLVHKEKVKWYQSGFFKIFVIIVAVILIVIVAYYGMANIAGHIATAIFGAGTGAAYAMIYWVVYFVLSFAIGTVIAMAGENIGGIWGMALIIIGSIVLARGGGPRIARVQGSFGNVINYINTVGPYLEGAQRLYSYYVGTQLQDDWETFMLNAREKERLLEEAWNSLESPHWLSPWDIIATNNNQYEEPGQFLYRTKNTNPGRTANDVIHNFVRMALNLPRYPMEQNIVQDMFEGFQQQTGRVKGVT